MSDSPATVSHELLRSSHAEEIDITVEVLQSAGITHRVVPTEADADFATLGQRQVGTPMAVVVAPEDAKAAREALESAYAESELPENHFLRTASDAEIAEILSKPDDWSAFDVTHARRLAEQRGLDSQRLPEVLEAHEENKSPRMPAPAWLVPLALAGFSVTAWFGWTKGFTLLTNLGAILCVLLGQHLGWANQEHSDKPLYDANAVKSGKLLVVAALGLMLVLRLR
jgi:hypothetical protein